jgi:myosin heavy subunit
MMDGHTMKIHQCLLKNYFLEKSRIITQSLNERNFHIFYQLLAFLPDDQKTALRLKDHGKVMRFDDFRYLTNRTSASSPDDKKMWDDLNKSFISL